MGAAQLRGVKTGKWTMDFDAATRLAKKEKLPILLNFSGSDWCGWCKIMERNVFSKDEWTKYAKHNMVMVVLDFPSDKSLVPRKYAQRNARMKEHYAVSGFPTFILLDDDGKTELGRLSAGKDKTPASFRKELGAFVRYRDAEVARYVKRLKLADRQKYIKMIRKIKEHQKKIQVRKEQIAAASKDMEKLSAELIEQEQIARGFRASKLDAAGQKKYWKLKEEIAAAEKEYREWLGSQPAQTSENRKRYESMVTGLQELAQQLARY